MSNQPSNQLTAIVQGNLAKYIAKTKTCPTEEESAMVSSAKSRDQKIESTKTNQSFEPSFRLSTSSLSASRIPNYRPYKIESLIKTITKANKKGLEGHRDILKFLKENEVAVFMIECHECPTNEHIMKSVKNVIQHVAKTERIWPSFNPCVTQRCLLYKDKEGRIFNLIMDDYAAGLEDKWRGLLSSFSTCQAVIVWPILCRSFACLFEGKYLLLDLITKTI